MRLILPMRNLHAAVFGSLERLAGDWFLPLCARTTFLAVLFFYFHNSWKTKVEGGLAGFLSVMDSAYYQIVPWAVDAAGGEISQVGFLNHAIVFLGTTAEIVLPVLIVAGLFTRAAALGMIVFIGVQSWVDINFHGVNGDTAGALFDRFSDSLVADQRTLWVFLLLVLVVKGAGAVSLDALFSRLSGFNVAASRPAIA